MSSGNRTLVPMKVASGNVTPTQIHLPDATTVFPDGSGQFMIPAPYVTDMMNAGLQIVVSGGHVP
jgi:hypothetical protein